ncbi:hypothetical protein ACIPPM_15275 [Streptomyces sp. NPDC090119]|uniref:hypothetical protein n=1 Tax=Streptomyces sp. NPDC090119 TaxID=3365951 RepID=UPI0038227271
MAAARPLNHPEMVRYAGAVVEALGARGCPPDERWDEARGVALYWTTVTECRPRGLLVFWHVTDGWQTVPLNDDGVPVMAESQPLSIDTVAAPDAVAEALLPLVRGDAPPAA